MDGYMDGFNARNGTQKTHSTYCPIHTDRNIC